jgi:hypothetical protein
MNTPNPPPSLLDIDWNNLGLWLWSVFLCLLGGFVRFTQKIQAGHARPWNFTELIGEMAMSAFVGSLAYKGCLAFGVRPDLTPAIVGVTSHMGARALFKLEVFVNFFANRKLGLPADAPAPAKESDHAAE